MCDRYPSVMVPQQCTNTPHGGSDGYCKHHTVREEDRLPHSIKAVRKAGFGASTHVCCSEPIVQ